MHEPVAYLPGKSIIDMRKALCQNLKVLLQLAFLSLFIPNLLLYFLALLSQVFNACQGQRQLSGQPKP